MGKKGGVRKDSLNEVENGKRIWGQSGSHGSWLVGERRFGNIWTEVRGKSKLEFCHRKFEVNRVQGQLNTAISLIAAVEWPGVAGVKEI